MAADRPRFQFAIQDLLEFVAWVALGVSAIQGAIALEPPAHVLSRSMIENWTFGWIIGLWMFLFYLSGFAFGAAVGVVLRRRLTVAMVGAGFGYCAWLCVYVATIH